MTVDVSVELAPADESAPEVQLLVEACSMVMHPARCIVDFSTNSAREEGRATAIVRWNEDHTDAHIEVRVPIHGTPAWRTREMSFSRADPEGERWRTVGYAIATLVGESAVSEESTSAVDVSPSVTPVQRDRVRQDSHASDGGRSWIDAQFVFSTGIPGLAPALGGELGFSSLVLGDRFFVHAALQGTYQRWTLDKVSVLQANASGGAGFVMLRLPRFDLAVRAQALLYFMEGAGIDPTTGNAGNAQRWEVGFAEQVCAAWMWSNRIGLVAGVGFSEMTGATELIGHGQVVAIIPAVHLDSAAGLRWRFP